MSLQLLLDYALTAGSTRADGTADVPDDADLILWEDYRDCQSPLQLTLDPIVRYEWVAADGTPWRRYSLLTPLGSIPIVGWRGDIDSAVAHSGPPPAPMKLPTLDELIAGAVGEDTHG